MDGKRQGRREGREGRERREGGRKGNGKHKSVIFCFALIFQKTCSELMAKKRRNGFGQLNM